MHVRPWAHARTILVTAALVTATACAGPPEAATTGRVHAAGYPVSAESCGFTSTVDAPPKRAVTLNQGATEVALALGLQDRLIGTAYLDDGVAPRWQKAYASVDVMAKEYPSRESLLAARPDFTYASYSSAYDAKNVGSQKDLDRSGVDSYLSPFSCGPNGSSTGIGIEQVWDEIAAVADVFDVPERAARVENDQRQQLAEVVDDAEGKGRSVFWFDSGDKTAYAAAGEGGPQIIMDAVGAENVFDAVKGGWADVSWEKVVEADPDVIVLVDASWSSAAEKKKRLQTDPALRRLRAVEQRHIVTVPFSESTPGVRLVDGAARISDQLDALDLTP